jgi:ATP-dependent DNA helicase DinG
MNDYLHQVLGDGGLFASHFAGYEMREGQVALARMVDQAMRGERHALGEAGCGVGKSFAYSIPAVWHAHHQKKRVVIVTANIALQEQLYMKDLPTLAKVLPWPFTFSLLKGRANYLCKARLSDPSTGIRLGALGDVGHRQQAKDVLAWAKHSQGGDTSELPFIPAPAVWSCVSVGADDCGGNECTSREECFFEKAKARAIDADIIVTNYHLLFAHLALRKETGQDLVLPPFDTLILDEAHEAADIARGFFGFSLSEFTFSRLARAAGDLDDKHLAAGLREDSYWLFVKLAQLAKLPQHRRRLKLPGFTAHEAMQRTLSAFANVGIKKAGMDSLDLKTRTTARNSARAATTAGTRLEEALLQKDADKVYWLELDAKGRARLCAKPIDVSALLREELFGRCASVCLVSATLTTSGTFDFVRRELGVPEDALEVIAETPFDFKSQSLLVVPEGLPSPKEPGFVDAAGQAFQEVVEACDGRTLGLFTSYRGMNAVYDKVAGGRHRVLRQGELPRAELVRIFKEDIGSVLLGTESFWTGIDVPGEALTAVVIDKLPFPSPEDPLIDALCEKDKHAFDKHLVPRAIIALRQGVGRLIRSQGDIGVVVILDKRIAESRYGRKFLRSLPPMLSSRRIQSIPRFLDAAGRVASRVTTSPPVVARDDEPAPPDCQPQPPPRQASVEPLAKVPRGGEPSSRVGAGMKGGER